MHLSLVNLYGNHPNIVIYRIYYPNVHPFDNIFLHIFLHDGIHTSLDLYTILGNIFHQYSLHTNSEVDPLDVIHFLRNFTLCVSRSAKSRNLCLMVGSFAMLIDNFCPGYK